MKTWKRMLTLALSLVMTLSLAACGGGAGKTLAFSEYISQKGTVVLYADDFDISKDSKPIILVFENGRVSLAKSEATFGELSKMSDADIAQMVKNNERAQSKGTLDMEYLINVHSDSTGNGTKYEELVVYNSETGGYRRFQFNGKERGGTVFDSYYSGLKGEAASFHLYARCKEGQVPFTLDAPGAKGVETDLDSNELKARTHWENSIGF